MSPNSKDRLIYSVAGGMAIPAFYGIAVALLTACFMRPESAPPQWLAWLFAPVVWPAYLYYYLAPPAFNEWARAFLPPESAFVLSVLAANFVLYSLLTYALIRWRQRMPRLR